MTAIRDEDVVEPTMNAVIIYDDCAGAAKAKLMLERAARRADAALLWIVKPWRLDLLVPSLAADAALTDAADAHLMVLVLRHSPLLPAWLQDWFAQWAARRQVQDAALALWDGGNGDMLPATIERDLSQFAERHGLSFIYGGVGPAEDESATGARSEREMFSSPTLQPIRERALEGN
jgi:hypothetical protein